MVGFIRVSCAVAFVDISECIVIALQVGRITDEDNKFRWYFPFVIGFLDGVFYSGVAVVLVNAYDFGSPTHRSAPFNKRFEFFLDIIPVAYDIYD